jgi:acetyl coenzyme A synthetase (ADP forming)-like protein
MAGFAIIRKIIKKQAIIMDPSLAPFFSPRGIALIGVSQDPAKLGYGLARNLIQSGYPGAVHLVNPRGGELLGHPVYVSLTKVPDPLDLAVILASAVQMPGILRECASRGVKAAIIAAGGFRETGAEGLALEEECLAIAREKGMRLLGPNCIGIIDTHLPMDTTFLQPPPAPVGEIAFISHSGAICAGVVDYLRGQGIGISGLYSLGNQLDVNETSILEPVADQPHTSVITLYMEGVSNGRDFVETARRVSRRKPVLALKVGRFDAGRKAAASHTGALAGQETAFDAGFARAGVIRAGTTQEMFRWARMLAWSPILAGRRIAVLTNAGGPGVTAADALELNGLQLAELSPSTQEALKTILPPAASLHNPVDMLASAMPEDYSRCLEILLKDKGVDGVMIITPPPPSSSAGGVAKAIFPVLQTYRKPAAVVLMGDLLVQEGVQFLRAARIPEFTFPEDAASALAVLSRRSEMLVALEDEPVKPEGIHQEKVKKLLQGKPAGFLPQYTTLDLFETYGFRTVGNPLAGDADTAASLAEKCGYPVAIKVASADIPHKSDVGGVLLGVMTPDEVRAGFLQVISNASQAKPDARIEGATIQRMIPAGQDVIVGTFRDPQFGPLVMFGSGGVEVEGLKDVAFALAPLTRREAEGLLEKTWAGRKLKGFRSLVPADREAVLDALVRIGQLAVDHPRIQEMEINPLRALPEGQGAYALDIRVRID